MHLYKTKTKLPAAGVAGMVVIFAVILIYFYVQIGGISKNMESSDAQVLKDALQNAIVTCYAIEGSYPKSLDYIEEHYGIRIDTDKYLVDYRFMLDNEMPELSVYTLYK